MTSLGDKRGPFSLDSVTIKHKGANITTILNSPIFDGILENLEDYYDYEVGYIPKGYEHRPDLISNVFYGTPKNWWLLMLVNGVTDPFEGLNAGDEILVPILK